MCGLNGTWAWLPHRVQTTAKYSRGPPLPPFERPAISPASLIERRLARQLGQRLGSEANPFCV
jgi:hypothetical protein